VTSSVGICNQALVKIGAERITSLLDDDENAKVLNAIYEVKRDAELTAHPWTFAIKRAQIPASSTAPAFGWARSFPLPADYLTLVEVGEDYTFYDSDTGALFALESDPATGGMSILTDQPSPLNIRYIFKVENPGRYPATFVESFACRLAAEITERRSQSLSKRQQAWDEYKFAIRTARRMNAIEQPAKRIPAGSWVRALDLG
jgi:hypothetical protein